jgi:hypothetical protein
MAGQHKQADDRVTGAALGRCGLQHRWWFGLLARYTDEEFVGYGEELAALGSGRGEGPEQQTTV